MEPVRLGERGPAVEDIQRRLLLLGHDLGPAGIDGVFLGCTADAILTFQQEAGVSERGVVGDETWSALVDETFTLGDRMLYLRFPYFHGRDVRVAQQALNSLGFTCGASDGIFGPFTERAVREFQRNSGVPADGIVGEETVSGLMALRHVWEGQAGGPHSGARSGPVRSARMLARISLCVVGADARGVRVAQRLVNLGKASEPASGLSLAEDVEACSPGRTLVLFSSDVQLEEGWRVVPVAGEAEAFSADLRGAPAKATGDEVIAVDMRAGGGIDERDEQRLAVLLLDALCMAFD